MKRGLRGCSLSIDKLGCHGVEARRHNLVSGLLPDDLQGMLHKQRHGFVYILCEFIGNKTLVDWYHLRH